MYFYKNIQFQQLINLLLLIYISYTNNTLQTNPFIVLLLIVFAGATELILKKDSYIPYSAFITAIGVVLMVGWTKWYIPFIIIFLAIFQKLYLKIDGKHIFNPSNFALIVAIFIFYPKALPIVGALGTKGYILYLVLIIGTFVLIRANRYLITLSFLLIYLFLNYTIVAKIDPNWNIEHFISSIYSISFIVYIFFMLTDPITTPNNAIGQLIFGSLVAFLIVTLNYILGYRVWNIFISLFIASLLFAISKSVVKKDFSLLLIIVIIFSITITCKISTLKPLYFSM